MNSANFMKDINLKTQQEVDSLTPEERSRGNSFAYEHEILWYGLEGFAHFWLMKNAKKFIEQGKTPQELQAKYDLKRGDKIKHSLAFIYGSTFAYPLSKVTQDGIYIPKYSQANDRVLFNVHDIPSNRRFQDNIETMNLCRRRWNLEDFANMELVEQGMIFGKELWKTGVVGFNRYKGETFNEVKQSEKVTSLGEKLIEYYSAIMEEH